MRVRSVMIEGHPGLGDLDVNLCSAPDEPAPRAVVIAGENGTGKTALLEVIHRTLQRDLQNSRARRVTISLDLDERFQSYMGSGQNHRSPADFDIKRPLTVSVEYAPSGSIGRTYRWTTSSGASAAASINLNVSRSDPERPDFLWHPVPVFFSEATVGFDIPPISALGSITPGGALPHEVAGKILPRGGASLGAEIAKLLVDLRTADAADLQQWVEKHSGEAPPRDLPRRRWARFSEAFSYMFPRKRLLTIDLTRDGYRVMFEEDGRQSTLETLSTGEKQIVFRGGYLLEFAEELPGALVLVDEPELSLHPSWQARIPGFYDHIAGSAVGQILFATHSPYVVHGSPTARHVVLERDASGKVVASARPTYPGVAAETAVSTFDLASLHRDLHDQPMLLIVEGRTDRDIIEEAWRHLRPERQRRFVIRDAGGAQAISTLIKQPSYFDVTAHKRTVVLFDFDEKGWGQWLGSWGNSAAKTEADPGRCLTRRHTTNPGWALLLPVPSFRADYAADDIGPDSKLTIELLFPDEFIMPFAVTVRTSGGGRVLRVTDGRKAALVEAVKSFPSTAFNAFEPLFQRLEEMLETPVGALAFD